LKTLLLEGGKEISFGGYDTDVPFFNGATTPTETFSVFDYEKEKEKEKKRARGKPTTFDEPVH
jgi:hypothetical protein